MTVLAETPLYAEASPTAPLVAILPVGGSGSMLTTHGIGGFAQVLGPGGWIGWAEPRTLGPLGNLLPTQADLGVDLPVVDDRIRTAEEVAATFPDSVGTVALLRQWGMRENVIRQFATPDGVRSPAEIAVVDVSLYTFSGEEGADDALAYFATARAEALGLERDVRLQFGDHSVAIAGDRPDSGFEATVYVRQDLLLARISTIGQPASATALTSGLAEALIRQTEG